MARHCSDVPSHKRKEPQPGRGAGDSARTSPWFRGAPQSSPRPSTPLQRRQPAQAGGAWSTPPIPSKQPHSGSRLSLEMFSGWFYWRCSQGGFADQPRTTMQPRSGRGLGSTATTRGEAALAPVPATSQELGSPALRPWQAPCSPACRCAFPSSAWDTNTHSWGKNSDLSFHFSPIFGTW